MKFGKDKEEIQEIEQEMKETLNSLDVGLAEDLTQSLMHLTAIEHHATMSYYATQEPKWLELKDIARQIRTRWLEAIVKKENAEGWCISKHLLSSSISMDEVGTRLYSDGKIEEAKQAFADSSLLIGLLFTINELKGGQK